VIGTGQGNSSVSRRCITTAKAGVDNSTRSYFFLAESGSWASEQDDLKIRGISITTT
jgi:hypothetical protein